MRTKRQKNESNGIVPVKRATSQPGPKHARFPGVNVAQTAARYGVSKSQLARLLNGESTPSVKTMRVLQDVLGKSMEEIVGMYADKARGQWQRNKAEVENAGVTDVEVETTE